MEHLGDNGSVFDIMWLLYVVVAFCVSWGLVVFGLAAFVLACMGKYSWKALGVLLGAILLAVLFAILKNGEGLLYCMLCSPIVAFIMHWTERDRKVKLKHLENE